MTQNIEQRTEVAVKKYESASDVVDLLVNSDALVETGAGERKSFPMLSREIAARAESQHTSIQTRSDNQHETNESVFNSQVQRQQTEFQNRFSESSDILPWTASAEVTQDLQRYSVGVNGDSGYAVYLPNPEKVPFTTSNTFSEDIALDRWSDNSNATKSFVHDENKNLEDRVLYGKRWPKTGDAKVGDTIPSGTTDIQLSGSIYKLSTNDHGEITGINLIDNSPSIDIGSTKVYLIDGRYESTKYIDARAFFCSPMNADNAAPSRQAMIYASVNKLPLKYIGGVYTFQHMEDNYYVEWLPNVSIIVEDGSEVKAGTGINSGVKKLRGMFVQLDKSKSLGDVTVSGTFNLNGANNLILPLDADGTKNAAVLALSASSITVDMKVVNNAGRQCACFGEEPGLVKTVTLRRFECYNAGSGLPGNYEQTDHSNIYVVSDDFIVTSAKSHNTQEPRHVVTAIETHAKRTTVNNLHTNENVTINYIVAAVEQSIESASIDNSVCNGNMFVEPFTSAGKVIGALSIGDSNSFTKTFGTLSALDFSSQMKGTGGAITIGEMVFDNKKTTNDALAPVVLLGRWRTTSIGKCVVVKCDARFVQAGDIQDNNSSLYIDGAITEHTNQNDEPGINQLIRLSGNKSFANVSIKGMRSSPKSGTSSATVGVSIECPISLRMEILDNDFAGTISTDIIDNSSPSPASRFFIRHRGATVPSHGMKAAAGSTVWVEGVDRYELQEDGSDWKRKPLKKRELLGSPVGASLPFFLGEEILDTQARKWWKSVGSGNQDWVEL